MEYACRLDPTITSTPSALSYRASAIVINEFPDNSLLIFDNSLSCLRKGLNNRYLSVYATRYAAGIGEIPCIFPYIRENSRDDFVVDSNHRQINMAPVGAVFICGSGGIDEDPLVRAEHHRCETTSSCSDGGPEGVRSFATNHPCLSAIYIGDLSDPSLHLGWG